MDCTKFEELMIEYLDCALTRGERREFCEHLLVCRECHIIFDEVRQSIDACKVISSANAASQCLKFDLYGEIEERVIGATTAGEMLRCRTLDAIISDYFDGLIAGSYKQVFNKHFAECEECLRLVEGIRQSLTAPPIYDVPDEIYDRIFAATVGARR